jgi:hypothetical protein
MGCHTPESFGLARNAAASVRPRADEYGRTRGHAHAGNEDFREVLDQRTASTPAGIVVKPDDIAATRLSGTDPA